MIKPNVIFIIFAIVVSSCASSGSWKFSSPQGNKNIYLERSFFDVISMNIAPTEAYDETHRRIDRKFLGDTLTEWIYIKHFRFSSEVYIQEINSRKEIIWSISDNSGTRIDVKVPYELYRNFRLSENADFDHNKLYTINYVFSSAGPNSDIENVITIENIIGLLSYDESRRRVETSTREESERTRQQDFNNAMNSSGIEQIVRYINNHGDFDNLTMRKEIAKRITNNRNVEFELIVNAPNPYAFSTSTVYYCMAISISNTIRGQIIGEIISAVRGLNGTIIVVNTPNISSFRNSISNAFLKYTGVTTVRLSSGGTTELATFDLLFSF